ncbi:MAG: amidohydrolase family protein [Alphaproteobacteria bacterium]|nr:amidohydrolase family protein [Alphaproteobacteria bacterium]
MSHPFNSGCACCMPRGGLSRRQFLCGTASAAAAVPLFTAGFAGDAMAQGRRRAGRPILLKGGIVLSLDKAVGDFERADVLIEGTKISAVRPDIDAPNARVIDASRSIVMPGFVDTHRHMWQGFLRGVLPDGSLQDYIQTVQRKFGANFVPDDVYAAEVLSGLGCIDAGVTTVLDWSHIHNSPEHTDAAIQGLKDSGVRAVFAYGTPQTVSGNWREAPKQKYPGDIARLRKQYFNSGDQLLTLYLASPGGAPDQVMPIWKAARDAGAPITIHVGVGTFGRSAFLEKMHALEPLKSDTTYIHCCTLNDTEWKLIKDSGGTISIAGYVEMLMGHGNPPTQKALDMGIRPSLSVDVETSVPNDFFTQMRSVFSLQKNEVWAKRLAGEKTVPEFLKVRDVLEFATVEGARANGLSKKVGTLTPGKEADVIMLRTDLINVTPINSAVGAVVTSMSPQNVDTVLIAGRVVKRRGRLVGVDMNRVNRMGREAQARAYKAAGLPDKRI